MIKTFLVAMTCLTSAVICAQDNEQFGFSKGDFAISGGIRLGNSKFENRRGDDTSNQFLSETKQFSFEFEPAIRYFLSDHLALGASLSTGRIKSESVDRSKSTYDSWKYGVFGNYYYTTTNRFSLFNSLEATIINGKDVAELINENVPNEKNTQTTKGFEVGLAAGANYFVSSHFAINARIGVLSYETSEFENDAGDTSKESTFNLTTQLQNITFGLLYRI